MKRSKRIILITIPCVAVAVAIGFYLYEVIWKKVPYDKNLFRTIILVCALSGTIVKVLNAGGKRRGLSFYEKLYANDIGDAFQDNKGLRNKLLSACRLYGESNFGTALKQLNALY